MTICTRRGCGFTFTDQSSKDQQCRHHPGSPVFHEGLKSWSCCKEINKPVMEFDQFLAIPGCEVAQSHSDQKQPLPDLDSKSNKGKTNAEVSSSSTLPVIDDKGNQVDKKHRVTSVTPLSGASLLAAKKAEQVTLTSKRSDFSSSSSSSSSSAGASIPNEKARKAEDEETKEEDADVLDPTRTEPVQEGKVCKRSGCGFRSDGKSQSRVSAEDLEREDCRYHKGSPIFHEGSKGWSCCKRRVLDFDDFLRIEGCTTSTKGHLFFGKPEVSGGGDGGVTLRGQEEEEMVECRMDHYETPSDLRLTVYAKGVDMGKSSIVFKDDEVILSLSLPPLNGSAPPRRFQRTLETFSTILPDQSSFQTTKFKVDLVLTKAEKGQSWPCLERGEKAVGYGLTFGRGK
ncbi:chord-domain-containing protein [Violaceomyces palustris]|uniref:Chord-domain-containing protein n=1 Tax=Violaceomyces palustris TaxID=1673888 RepID=A0ACD0NQ05_9BASI|nr:chord-domain-containing protein [Violaceomyces palustris]